jgi:4-hydroxy-3-methylbut-2-enyl diphosphate reductase
VDIQVIEPVGFCPGVKRAFELALQAIRCQKGSVYLLGDLVHNRHAIEKLQENGVVLTENPEEIPRYATVITRSHGIEKGTLRTLEERNAVIIDTTCPRVRRARDLAQSLEKRGYALLILGNQNHPEIRSLLSFLESSATVLKTKEEWEGLDMSSWQEKKIAVLAQTTFPGVLFEAFLKWKRERWPQLEMEIFNTLCSETETRQKNLVQKIREGALTTVIVVGGRKSSNTASLFLLARGENIRTIWVEGPEDLSREMFLSREKIGVVSGASTPDWVVEQVVDRLRKWNTGEAI